MSANSNPTANPASSEGIDIHKALEILSDRHSESNASSHSHGKGGCCHGAPENAKNMGQIIDLMKIASNKVENSSQEERQKEEQRIKEERAKRRKEIHEQLSSMTATDLLKAVFTSQQDRVMTYKEYERYEKIICFCCQLACIENLSLRLLKLTVFCVRSGLLIVLQTGNITSYPDACSKATASFSVLSETIKTIQEIFQSRQRLDLSKLIQQLQAFEKEKLQLTAAFHLERIRQRNQQQLQGDDPRITQLLTDGVVTLQQKIATCVENINEVLDELRCALLEEE